MGTQLLRPSVRLALTFTEIASMQFLFFLRCFAPIDLILHENVEQALKCDPIELIVDTHKGWD